MSNYGHKFEMFLADDLGLGGFVVNSLTWSMSGIKVARESVSKNSHKELSYAGVYFLLCTGRDGLLESVYIGESLDVKTRLKQHMNDYVKGVEPYFWQYAFCFTDSKLDKSLTLSLESELVALATAYNRTKLLTKQVSNKKVSRGSQVSVRVTLENIRLVLRAYGYNFLDSFHQNNKVITQSVQESSSINLDSKEDLVEVKNDEQSVTTTTIKEIKEIDESLQLVESTNEYSLPTIIDKDRRVSNEFLQVVVEANIEVDDGIEYYYIKHKLARAVCYFDGERVNVLAGSRVLVDKPKRGSSNHTHIRRDYIRSGVLQGDTFIFDTEFTSKNVAALVICMKTVEWKSMYE